MKRILGILFIGVVAVSLMMVPGALVGANPDPGTVWQIGVFDNAYNPVTDGTKITETTPYTRSTAPKGTVTVDYTDPSSFYSVLVPVTTITGTFTADLSQGAVLLVSWCPGKSGTEQFSVTLDGATQSSKTVLGTVCSADPLNGVCGWVPPYYSGISGLPYYTEIFDFGPLGSGPETHTLSIDYSQGDGIGFDYLKLSTPTPSARELKQDAIAELEDIKDLPCLGKCKGVSLLTLKYTGAAAASIEAISKGKTYFGPQLVGSGESFEIDAVDEKLGANTKMYVDGALNTEIHTSCSRPLRVGMRFGDFEVEDVDSLNEIDNAIKHIKKSLDPELWQDARHLDAKHGKKVFDEEKKAVKYLMAICKCKGIRSLTLEYSGGAGADVTVDKGIVTDNGDGKYTITPAEGKSKLGANTKIYVDGELAAKIHTSCSKPLQEDDVYGSFTVVGVVKVKGKVLFSDDFEDGDAFGWETIGGTWEVVLDDGNHVYSGTADRDEQISYALVAGVFDDFVIEAKAKAINDAGHYGIILREDGTGNHYGFYLNAYPTAEGKYFFGYYDGKGSFVGYWPIVGWTETDAYCDANVWNTLKVVASGYEFKLYINGILVNTVTDDDEHAASGYVGFIVDKHKTGQNTYFDDVSVLCRCKPEVVAEVHKVIKKLVVADEVLARTAIHEAENTPVIDEKNQDKYDREIAKAREEMDKAEEELMNKRPDKAIDHKKKAWEHAQHAIKEAMKPPKPPKP